MLRRSAVEQTEERGLAGARGSDEKHKLPLRHGEGDIVESKESVGVTFRNALQSDHRWEVRRKVRRLARVCLPVVRWASAPLLQGLRPARGGAAGPAPG